MTTTPINPASTRQTPPKPRRILIVDDHPILREGLARLLSGEPDLSVVGEADDAGTAAQLAEELQPDLAIVDIGLRGRNGIELVKDLQVRLPALPVLVLSMFDESLYGERARRAGARGYLMKLEAREKIVAAARAVLGGGTWFGARVPDASVPATAPA
ncbi:MAG TPA: response regulator transcription factor, partial [Tepidisphaeraceae bacterium]|nr:response regulator transcription factor [Tepidisphaeraceae bacterium]